MEGGREAKSGNFGAHDIGGLEGEYGAIDRTEKGFHLWEMQVSFLRSNSQYSYRVSSTSRSLVGAWLCDKEDE